MVHELPTIPAKEHHVALYLQSIGQQMESKSAAEEGVNALAWVHSLASVFQQCRGQQSSKSSQLWVIKFLE